MPREITVPAQTIREEIRSLEEFPPFGVTRGIVRALVGRVDANGHFIVPQKFETYQIEGDDYDALVAANGTYKNEDLWPFIDKLRNPPPEEPEEGGDA
jgi:hypothetical protein